MLIACIVVIALAVVFVCATYFMTFKIVKIKIEEKEIKVFYHGSNLEVFVDKERKVNMFAPRLISGESYPLEINDQEYQLKCKSNKLGNKLSVEIYKEDRLIESNKVEIKKTK